MKRLQLFAVQTAYALVGLGIVVYEAVCQWRGKAAT